MYHLKISGYKEEETAAQYWKPITLNSDRIPPAPIRDSIHIWQARFSEWQSADGTLAGYLSRGEQQHLQRFRDPVLATHYVISHGLLRALLEKYLGIAATEIQITTNDYGKPELWTGTGARFYFNQAHSEDMVLYGFSSQHSIGVDIEFIDQGFDPQLEARRILSNDEWVLWQSLSKKERISAFYQTWVRKEAALKALGIGLSIEPDTFSVGFDPCPIITHLQEASICLCDLFVKEPAKAAVALANNKMPQIRWFVAKSA
jgi:4'-phosphopantetheinyl transferase